MCGPGLSGRLRLQSMRTELVSIPTDTLPLDGLYFEPEGKAGGAALVFPANAMNCAAAPMRFLPPLLARLGPACPALNPRAHDTRATRSSRAAEGDALQRSCEDIEDNRLAARWLATRRFDSPVAIGHRNGR